MGTFALERKPLRANLANNEIPLVCLDIVFALAPGCVRANAGGDHTGWNTTSSSGIDSHAGGCSAG